MNLLPHLPVLTVVLPMLAAALCAVLPRGAWALATLAAWGSLASVLMLGPVTPPSSFSYPIGDWFPPIGIEYRVDSLSYLMLLVVTVVAALVLPFARRSTEGQIPPHKQGMYYAMFLLCLAGLLGMIVTHDAFNLYVFLEISSLATYTLIGMGGERRALSSAFQYLILGTIGATFILIGVGMLYMMTGTLNMADLAQLLPPVAGTRPVLAGFAFIIVGVSMKIALFPLHLWLPNAYAYAPHAASAFLAATATKVGFYVLLRFIFSVFGHDFSFITMPVGHVLLWLSVPAVLIGSLAAIYQINVKRLLAYSSIAQVGYIAMGIGLGSAAGLTAGITHLANHALAKGALFMAIACMAAGLYREGEKSLSLPALRGLGRKMPWSCLAFTLAGLALIGVPLSSGFVSKWLLAQAVLASGYGWLLVAVIILGSLLAVAYLWRVVEALYFGTASPCVTRLREAPASMLIPTWIMVLLAWYTGMDTTYTAGLAEQAANFLLGNTATQLAATGGM